MKALVTGGTGFVGAHVARALNEAGHSVRILHRATSRRDALDGVDYESVLGDILDAESLRAACEGCDWVFHVAAVADYWRADKTRMIKANVEGTQLVLNAAREAGVKRVVFTSSAAAVGFRNDGKPSDETDTFNWPPSSFPYAHSKVLAEQVVQEAVKTGQDVVIVNPVVVMGPGDLNLISGNFLTQIRQLGLFTPMTWGGVAVIDVRDVARMHIAAAERGITGERYILGTENIPYVEWFKLIADTVGARRPFIIVPNFILPLVAGAIDLLRSVGIQTPIDSNQARIGGRLIYFDFSKGWDVLGKPRVDMRQSVRDTYTWYVAHGVIK